MYNDDDELTEEKSFRLNDDDEFDENGDEQKEPIDEMEGLVIDEEETI